MRFGPGWKLASTIRRRVIAGERSKSDRPHTHARTTEPSRRQSTIRWAGRVLANTPPTWRHNRATVLCKNRGTGGKNRGTFVGVSRACTVGIRSGQPVKCAGKSGGGGPCMCASCHFFIIFFSHFSCSLHAIGRICSV